jgi:uncharacterized NAD-dependent epimerase/dehydratase family protein
LCHLAQATHIKGFDIPLRPLPELITLHEQICAISRPPDMPPARVLGIAVNTSPLVTDAEAQDYLTAITQQTGLPASDPVRFGVVPLWHAVQQALANVNAVS